ncbi:hypothetical protein NDU88_005119 [Pleurodeles waltl]|uniref:Uncharacterized protein n=1 Tax=Pleurodeles waltl TaxID=8319 RepID=A0AAV7TW82_PLEWA|nr:hypothetical protein NDU88_005119 [Pleurodeles waltl]
MRVYVSFTTHAQELSRVSLSAALSPVGSAPARAPGPGPQNTAPPPGLLPGTLAVTVLLETLRVIALPGPRRPRAARRAQKRRVIPDKRVANSDFDLHDAGCEDRGLRAGEVRQ